MPLQAAYGFAPLVVLVIARATLAIDEVGIDAAIKRGTRALLSALRDDDEIEYKRGADFLTVRGAVTKSTKDEITLRTADGKTLSLARSLVRKWNRAGLVDPDREPPYCTGPSTLAAFALVSAGVATSHPKMQQLLAALEEVPSAEGGTYVHSLRASLWSALLDRPLGQAQRIRYHYCPAERTQ